jgi:putative transposase
MSGYAAARRTPAALAEIRRRKAQSALQSAAGANVRDDLLQWALAGAVRHAVELMDNEVAERAGERYDRWDGRQGYRNGTAPGYVAVGGRKVAVRRPRLVDGAGRDLPLVSYAELQDPESMNRTALAKVIAGVAQRGVNEDLKLDQPLPAEQRAYGASKSSISRRWIAATEGTLADQAERRLDGVRYLAILLDGKGFGEHLQLAGMGIDEQGQKHVLGVWEGDSENAEVCKAALEDLGRRGLDVRCGVLVIIDGGKGLAAGVRELWGDVAIVGRCRLHKQKNVFRHLPKGEQRRVHAVLQQAWHEPDADLAQQDLLAVAAELDGRYPAAAASLREGLAETLTCQRLGLPPELIRALGTTNLIENAFATTESICHRVCRWRNGAQAQRWATMALLRAEQGFHPVATAAAMAVLARAIAIHLQGGTEAAAAD